MNTISRLSQYGSFILSGEYDEINEIGIKLSGLGSYFSEQFSENVGIGTTLFANTYRPYDILNGQFSHVTYTPGLGVYMRQNNNSEVDVYNEIDDVSFLPKVIITPSSLNIAEGETMYFDVMTSNISEGTTLYYEIVSPKIVEVVPSSDNVSVLGSISFDIRSYNIGIGTTLYYDYSGVGINSSYFVNSLISGFIDVDSTNVNTITQTISDDYDSPSKKFFVLNIREDGPDGNIIAKSSPVSILPLTLEVNVSASTTSVISGGSVTFTANVSGSQSGTLYYRISGDIGSSNFSDNLLYGSFSYTNGSGQITKTLNTSSNISFILSVENKKSVILGTSPTVYVEPVTAISTWSDFNSQAVSGQTINLLGQSGTVRTFTVYTVPTGSFAGTKAITFPVTWPGTSFLFNNQNQTSSFSMTSSEFSKLQDVDYIFTNRNIGVHPISGASESCCDPYGLVFDGRTFFSTRGSNSSQFYSISFNGTITNNSGYSFYTTDGSVNGGSGLYGSSGYFYLF